MNIATIANIFVPLSAAVTSFVIVTLNLYYHKEKERTHSVKVLWCYFGCCIVNWSAIFFYFYMPNIFLVLNSLIMFTFIIVQVLFYNFLFFITRIDAQERFPRIHFIIPIIVFLFLSILMLLTPIESQKLSVMGRGEFVGGNYLFFVVSNSKMPVRLIFSLIYTGLGFVRLYEYRKQVENYSANYEKSSLRWVKTYLFLSLSLIPVPLIGIILPRGAAASSAFLSIQNLVIVFQYSFLCFHVIRQNYIYLDYYYSSSNRPNEALHISDNTDYQRETSTCDNEDQSDKLKFTKAYFESFIATERPYLNADLRLIDVAVALKTNRTYLSAFINREYGVNFNRLINSFRLQELERLKQLETINTKTEKELVEMVGFGSYRNFRRFVNQDD